MKDTDKTKEQLITGLAGMHQQTTELEASQAQRKQTNEALEESEKKYRTLFTESRDAIFITTQDGKLIDANQSFLELFGYTTEEALGLDVRKTYVNPDDRLTFQQEMEQEGAVRDFELKLQKKDGTELDCLLTATVRRSEDGDVLGYHGIIRDITQRKRMEKALRESEEKYRTTLENTGAAMLILEEDTTISLANHQFEILSGYYKHEIEGKKSWTEFVHQEDLERMKQYYRQRRQPGETAPRHCEFRFVNKAGNIKNIFITMDIIPGTKKSVASLNNITEQVRLREELRAMSLTDELTGLYNRRGFLTLAQQQVKMSQRTKKGMLLLYTDLDGLKVINDTLGHYEGDRALLQTANILQQTFRRSDIIARIGGDEFVVLAAEANEDSGERLAARLQHKLETHNAKENRGYKLSLSIGTAYYDPDNPCSVGELLNRADQSMYEHKESKRKGQLKLEYA